MSHHPRFCGICFISTPSDGCINGYHLPFVTCIIFHAFVERLFMAYEFLLPIRVFVSLSAGIVVLVCFIAESCGMTSFQPSSFMRSIDEGLACRRIYRRNFVNTSLSTFILRIKTVRRWNMTLKLDGAASPKTECFPTEKLLPKQQQ